jgi:hypothetical protein
LPPVDVDARASAWQLDETLVAVAAGRLVGELRVEESPFGFVEEGRRARHVRRANGELWDLIEMGLLL